ncbi:MAG TPA: glycosyltransferase family 4 protein [Gemmatimonadales bacterium]
MREAPDHDLLFAYDFPPMGGGIARWMAAMAERYPPGKLTVSSGTLESAEATDPQFPQTIDRIPVHSDRLRTVAGLLAWSRRAVSLSSDPAMRFAWCDSVRPAGYPARWAFRRTGLPYGIVVHGGDLLTLRQRMERSRFKHGVMRSILHHATVSVANSRWTAERLRDLLHDVGLPHAAARIRVVPLGTDPSKWRFDAEAAAAFRDRRNLPSGRWLVTVARMVEYKGIDTAIRIVAELLPTIPDVQYAVVGRGGHEEALRELAATLGVADRVHLLTDVGDDELAAAYSMATVYVGLTRETPTDVEGFGISFVEAAACGLAVIATRTGGIRDAVGDGETGLLFDPADLAGVTAILTQLLRDPSQARRIGAAGRARVERYLNWDRVVGDMQRIAEECGRRAARPMAYRTASTDDYLRK